MQGEGRGVKQRLVFVEACSELSYSIRLLPNCPHWHCPRKGKERWGLPCTFDSLLVHDLLGEALLVNIAPVAGFLCCASINQAVDEGRPRLAVAVNARNRLQAESL